MNHGLSIPLIDLVSCLSDAMDFIDPAIVNHHKQVAYISFCIGSEMGLSHAELRTVVLAGAIHDIGAFSLKERRNTFEFELLNGQQHAETGYSILKLFSPLVDVAEVVRYHHVPWKVRAGTCRNQGEIPVGSFILNLADRIAVLIDKRNELLGQAPGIIRKISEHSGSLFMPPLVDVFLSLAGKEYFWLDLINPPLKLVFTERIPDSSFGLGSESMLGFSRLFSRIIDFKSPFTATHSSGVAASAEFLAGLCNFSEGDCRLMRIAGNLHDLGKLAVPVEILDKPAYLQTHERNVIRHHAFYTYRLLQEIPALSTINEWAAFHHEHLDGTGYPFHRTEKDLPLGSQIMAVADVFTAVTENRPYRAGMPEDSALKVLNEMARDRALNTEIVSLLASRFHDINQTRLAAQAAEGLEYRQLTAAGQ